LLSFFFRILMQGRKLKEIAVITAILEWYKGHPNESKKF
jgi:hypothetical protein